MAISFTFNVVDLFEYHPPNVSSSHLTHSRLSSFHVRETDVDQIAKGIIDCRESSKNKIRSRSCRWSRPFTKLFPKFRTVDLCLNIRIYLLLGVLVFFLISIISFLNSYSPN